MGSGRKSPWCRSVCPPYAVVIRDGLRVGYIFGRDDTRVIPHIHIGKCAGRHHSQGYALHKSPNLLLFNQSYIVNS